MSYFSIKYDELGWGFIDKDFVDNVSDYFERNYVEYYMYIGFFILDLKMRIGNEKYFLFFIVKYS